MRNQTIAIFGLVLICSLVGSTASAQFFGSRPLPNPGLQQGAQPNTSGTTVSAGPSNSLIQPPAQGIDRFLRTSREGRDFVGRNRADIKSFIGAQQAIAAGQVRSATDGLRPNAAATSATKKINQPIPAQPAKGLYYPKLVLDLESEKSESTTSDSDPSKQPTRIADPQLLQRIQRVAGGQIQLQLTGTQAILSGRANSQRNGELAAQLLEFEPGIDRVVNQLK